MLWSRMDVASLLVLVFCINQANGHGTLGAVLGAVGSNVDGLPEWIDLTIWIVLSESHLEQYSGLKD